MKLYHTYASKNGKFDLKKIDWTRGVFCIKAWWAEHPTYKDKYTVWHPNEFGDTVVEIDVDENARMYKSSDNIDTLEKLFGKENPKVKAIIEKYEMGDFERVDWRKLDGLIGKKLQSEGYQIIYYTDDAMYGETWAIIDPKVIRGIRHEHDK